MPDDLATDHLLDDAVGRGVDGLLCANVFAIAQDCDGVAQAEDFFHAVRDVDDGDAALLELREKMEEMLTLVRGEGAGGFIHHDDLRVGADGGGDLDDLLLTGGETADGEIDIDVIRLDGVQHGAGEFAHLRLVDDAELLGHFAEAEIFRDGEVRAEGEFLVNHRDAKLAGSEWLGGMDRLVVQQDFPAV